MAYYKVCPHCGAHIDPGETCDCTESLREQLKAKILTLTEEECGLLLRGWKIHKQCPELSAEECMEKAAQGATNTPDGKVEQGLTANVRTPIITKKGG